MNHVIIVPEKDCESWKFEYSCDPTDINITRCYIKLSSTRKYSELYKTLEYSVNDMPVIAIDSTMTDKWYRAKYISEDWQNNVIGYNIISAAINDNRLYLHHLIGHREGPIIRLSHLYLNFIEPNPNITAELVLCTCGLEK